MDTKTLGRLGERAALQYLQSRGWEVLGQNVRVGRRELDLIMRRREVLAFVEVKTRRNRAFGDPLEAITPLKRIEVCRAASGWLRDRQLSPGTVVRFDAVGVIRTPDGDLQITHLSDAWRM